MPDFGLQQGDPGSLSFPNQIGYFLCFTNSPPPPPLPWQLQICQELCTSRMAFCVCEAEGLGERARAALSKTLAYLTGSFHHSSWISALQRSSRRKVSRRGRGRKKRAWMEWQRREYFGLPVLHLRPPSWLGPVGSLTVAEQQRLGHVGRHQCLFKATRVQVLQAGGKQKG